MRVLLIWNGPATRSDRSVLARREPAFLRELGALGVTVGIALCADGGGFADDLRAAGLDVVVLPPSLPPSGKALRHLPQAVLHLRRLIATWKPDLIEATEPMPAIAAGLAARRRGKTVLIYRRQHNRVRLRARIASRLAALLADKTIVSCEAMRQMASSQDGSSPDRIEIAATGIVALPPPADSEISSLRQTLGLTDSARVIVVICQLRHQKGVDVLIRSLEHLDDIADLHLIVAGNGPEALRLRRLAAGSSIPVHFLGHWDDVAGLLRLADVIAIPSRFESFGRLTLEAMAAGCAIVATRAGGLAEAIVDRQTGLLVACEDEQALAGAIRTLLADPALARQYGDAARARVESSYTIAHMAWSRRAAWERSLAAAGAR
jgi:glycosyltransferase involved in cell wall biosynthesis